MMRKMSHVMVRKITHFRMAILPKLIGVIAIPTKMPTAFFFQ
jgi:hypothetical protein